MDLRGVDPAPATGGAGGPCPGLGLSSRRMLALVLAAALLLRVAVLLAAWEPSGDHRAFHAPDSGSYILPARELLSHGTFTLGGVPEIRRTPGYPLFLIPGVLTGQLELTTALLQIGVSVATVFVVFLLALRLFASERVALLAAGMYALEPLSVAFTSYLLAETLFTFLLGLFALFAVRYLQQERGRDLALAALWLVLACYTRPIVLYLPFLTVAFLLVWQVARKRLTGRAWLHLAVFALIVGVGIQAWQVRNWLRSDQYTFSEISVLSLYQYHAGSVIARRTGRPFSADLMTRSLAEQRGDGGEGSAGKGQPADPPYREMQAEAVKVLRSHPLDFLIVYLKGILRVLFTPGHEEFWRLFAGDLPPTSYRQKISEVGVVGFARFVADRIRSGPFQEWFWPFFYAMPYLAAVYLAAGFGLAARAHHGPALWLILMTGGYLLLVSGGISAYWRFRHPLMPLLALLAAAGVPVLARAGGQSIRCLRALWPGRSASSS